jgi:hypothetical protein
MLSFSLITLVTLAASPFLGLPQASAYNGQAVPSPELWLANLRSATGAAAPVSNGPGVRSIRFSAGQSDFQCSMYHPDVTIFVRCYAGYDHRGREVRAREDASPLLRRDGK